MNDYEKLDDDGIHYFCIRWAEWCRNMRYFAPPLPMDSIRKLQPSTRRYIEFDPELSFDLNLFNQAAIAQPDDKAKAAFTAFYVHNVKHIKKIARKIGFSRQAFYENVKKSRNRAYTSFLNLQETNFIKPRNTPFTSFLPKE